jgi:lipopolysaccharide transport system permease protein
VPYPAFAYAAMLLWTFTSSAILSSSYSLVTNSQIITRVYFSRLILPTAAIAVRLIDFMIASLSLFVIMIYYRIQFGWGLVLVPVFMLEMAILALAVGVFAAALYVRYRDVGTLLPILLQAWMFVSPTVYSASIVPPRVRFIYALNPLVGIMGGFRSAWFNLPFEWSSIIASGMISLMLLVVSLQFFHALDYRVADEV